MPKHHIAVFMYSLSGGGVARRNITLANALSARGHRVDMVVVDARGELRDWVDASVRVVEVGGPLARLPWFRDRRRRQFKVGLKRLVAYLKRERPSVLLSSDNYANLSALEARRKAQVDMPVVISQRNHTSTSVSAKSTLLQTIKRAYAQADAMVGVSQGVSDDLVALGLPRERVHTIYNPVFDEGLLRAAAEPADHPWFADGAKPIVLGVGRITAQKDFDTLVRAFALMRRSGRAARLVILGEGKDADDRAKLLGLATSLGVEADVSFPGYVKNAMPYIARADLFVLSSIWEGFGAVVAEALACGTPIVSTDCPSGPSEIIGGGEFGRLVPMRDPAAMSAAMIEALDAPHEPERLKARAKLFSTEAATDRYLALFNDVVAARAAKPAR